MANFIITWFKETDTVEAESSEAALDIARSNWRETTIKWPDDIVMEKLAAYTDETKRMEYARRLRKEKEWGMSYDEMIESHGFHHCYQVMVNGDYDVGYTVRAI